MRSSKMSQKLQILILRYSRTKGKMFIVFCCFAKHSTALVSLGITNQFSTNFLLNMACRKPNMFDEQFLTHFAWLHHIFINSIPSYKYPIFALESHYLMLSSQTNQMPMYFK